MPLKTLILIPARMASTRLPSKALADIAGKPMIIHVAERAKAANLGRVVVATDHEDIKNTVENHGFEAVMTAKNHQSGSDRIYEALLKIDKDGAFEAIINVQGDLPTIAPKDIQTALRPLLESDVDIATLGVEITKEEEKHNPNIVKIIGSPVAKNRLRALYFTRATAPYGEGPLYHHIGLYAYRRKSLEKFVTLKPSSLELRESLEQLRAIEASMRIDVEIIQSVPLGVDTAQDLEMARQILSIQK